MKDLKVASAWLLMVAFLIAALVALTFAFRWGGRGGLVFSLLSLLTLFSIFFWLGRDRLLSWFRAQDLKFVEILGHDRWGMSELLRSLDVNAEQAKLFVVKSPSPTLFVSQTFRSLPIICFTDSLLDRLNPQERAAALCLALALRDSLSGLAPQFLFLCLNSCLGIFQALDEISPWNWFWQKRKFLLFQRAFSICTFVLARIFLTSHFYYRIDQRARELGAPTEQLAEVLWKLSAFAQTRLMSIPLCFLPQFPVEPGCRGHRPLLHPGREARIERLIGYYPL